MTAQHRAVDPVGLAPPAANYAHGVVTTGASRWLHTCGVVPIDADGSVPADLVAQAHVIWKNVAAILSDAQMSPADVVSVTTYVTPGHDLGSVMQVRDHALGGRICASTLVIVAELARPEWLMEIAVIAAS